MRFKTCRRIDRSHWEICRFGGSELLSGREPVFLSFFGGPHYPGGKLGEKLEQVRIRVWEGLQEEKAEDRCVRDFGDGH